MEFSFGRLSSPRSQAWMGDVERWSVGASERVAPRLTLNLPRVRERFMTSGKLPADHGADAALVAAEGVLAQRFGPKAVAVAVFTFAGKADIAAAGDLLLDAA